MTHCFGKGLRRGLVDRKLVEAPSNFITGRPNASCFGSFVILDVVSCYFCHSCFI